jgi:hypothetical protein
MADAKIRLANAGTAASHRVETCSVDSEVVPVSPVHCPR